MTVTCNYRSTAVIILPGVYLPPQRNATVADDAFSLLFISIHAPREGSDRAVGYDFDGISAISIHAPREGSDRQFRVGVASSVNFNPRSPRGERRLLSKQPLIILTISIHAPREGSDYYTARYRGFRGISIHAPREGSDAPARGGAASLRKISIHAPREGSDPFCR